MTRINATSENREILLEHAQEAMCDYSPVMTWLLLDEDGNLSVRQEPQGQSAYVGDDEVVAKTGDFYKAHGDGAARDCHGQEYTSDEAYLTDLLGVGEYNRIFN